MAGCYRSAAQNSVLSLRGGKGSDNENVPVHFVSILRAFLHAQPYLWRCKMAPVGDSILVSSQLERQAVRATLLLALSASHWTTQAQVCQPVEQSAVLFPFTFSLKSFPLTRTRSGRKC